MARAAKNSTRARTSNRLSGTERIQKQLRGMTPGVGQDVKDTVHVVEVYVQNTPVTYRGFLVSQDAHNVVFRHKRSSGSQKTRISTFSTRDVIQVFGAVGEPSSVTLLGDQLLATYKGQVRTKDGIVKIRDNVTGETTTLYPHPNASFKIYADEEGDAAASASGRGRGRKAKASSTKTKATRTRKKQKQDSDDEDFDDEL